MQNIIKRVWIVDCLSIITDIQKKIKFIIFDEYLHEIAHMLPDVFSNPPYLNIRKNKDTFLLELIRALRYPKVKCDYGWPILFINGESFDIHILGDDYYANITIDFDISKLVGYTLIMSKQYSRQYLKNILSGNSSNTFDCELWHIIFHQCEPLLCFLKDISESNLDAMDLIKRFMERREK